MESKQTTRPHAVCIPFPTQGHVNPMLKLAMILHAKGFHITFIHSENNHQRLLKSRGPHSLDDLPDFRYETFSDGLQPPDDYPQDIPSMCLSTTENGRLPIHNLITKLNNSASSGVPPVTYIISDGIMSFTLDIAKKFGVPGLLFWTTSACGFMGYLHYKDLIEKGLVPLKDNSYLETSLNWIDGMSDICLKDMPDFARTTDINDIMFNFLMQEANRASHGASIILNTFYDLEHPVLEAMTSILPPIYDIGPLHLLYEEMVVQKGKNSDVGYYSMGSNLWKEDSKCLEWLDAKSPGSILYVNFGSIVVLTNQQIIEIAWGLCNSNIEFLWIIRPDPLRGDHISMLPEEFLKKTKDRSMLSRWCSQVDVLHHPAIGGFLTHCGWNSMLESIGEGVPMICLPLFAEQYTNCRYSCIEWGIGLEIDNDVRREKVTTIITELMDGEKGKERRRKAHEWKVRAIAATQNGGTSFMKMEKLINEVLTQF